MPKLTVLMPAHNASRFVGDAIRSILSQSFPDFELLIIDDASDDDTGAISSAFGDPRIRLVRNPANLGVAQTLNRGLELACGEYVVRMDSDDISRPQRLARQWAFMEAHPRIGISGTGARWMGDELPVRTRPPAGSACVEAFLVFDNPLLHPTVIIRRAWLNAAGLRYDPVFSRSEDFELWTRAAAAERDSLDNLGEALARLRVHGQSVTRTKAQEMDEQCGEILRRQLSRLGVAATAEEVRRHRHMGLGRRWSSRAEVEWAERWLERLDAANLKSGGYTPDGFRRAAGMIWFRACANSTPLGWWLWRRYRRAPWSQAFVPPLAERLRAVASLLWHAVRKTGAGRAAGGFTAPRGAPPGPGV